MNDIIKCDKCGRDAFKAIGGEGVIGTDRSGLDLEEITHKGCGKVVCQEYIVDENEILEDPNEMKCPICGQN
jgi:hypothetical protein